MPTTTQHAAPGTHLVGGWTLTPEGAAVHEAERVAVVADVHLGYEWARARGGDVVPAHSLAETRAKLSLLLDRTRVDRLIVAGDLVESALPCPRTAADVRRLVAWLAARGVALLALRGNHDPPRRPPLPSRLDLDGWTIAHGDRPIDAPRVLVGHHHPALKAGGVTAPCFLIGPTTIALPAFSPNAAGFDVTPGTLPAPLRREPLGCLACADDALLDFGPVAELAAKFRSS